MGSGSPVRHQSLPKHLIVAPGLSSGLAEGSGKVSSPYQRCEIGLFLARACARMIVFHGAGLAFSAASLP